MIDPLSKIASAHIGEQIYDLIKRLFPICRSITGDGVRKTLEILREQLPLQTVEVPTGKKVLDWLVPQEWNIRDAYIKDEQGRKIVDFTKSNLHILNYSTPVDKTLTLNELRNHLYSLPDRPDWIPYRTSYYREEWGFCISHRQLEALTAQNYKVYINSTLTDGHLTYGEIYIPGKLPEEILISTHVCHPSLANDNLSGVCLAAFLARHIVGLNNRYSYRFIFIPGTIGAVTWLSLNLDKIALIKHGLVLTGIGDSGRLTYKKSRRGDSEIDQVAAYALKHDCDNHRIEEFSPYGYDERQYCSPGFNLPVGRLSRTPYGEYPEYHTSADNLDFVGPDALGKSFAVVANIFSILEHNIAYTNTAPFGEPQLGKRGLYDHIGPNQMAMLWVLNLSDSHHSLLDIAIRSGINFSHIRGAAETLHQFDLLTRSKLGK